MKQCGEAVYWLTQSFRSYQIYLIAPLWKYHTGNTFWLTTKARKILYKLPGGKGQFFVGQATTSSTAIIYAMHHIKLWTPSSTHIQDMPLVIYIHWSELSSMFLSTSYYWLGSLRTNNTLYLVCTLARTARS